jgi:hypothetical protein
LIVIIFLVRMDSSAAMASNVPSMQLATEVSGVSPVRMARMKAG